MRGVSDGRVCMYVYVGGAGIGGGCVRILPFRGLPPGIE